MRDAQVRMCVEQRMMGAIVPLIVASELDKLTARGGETEVAKLPT